MKTCPICSRTILRHLSGGRDYWFCTHCHQEVPDLVGSASRERGRLKLKTSF